MFPGLENDLGYLFMIMGQGVEKTRDFSHWMNRTPLSSFIYVRIQSI
jgi:hypothetical protein